MTRIFYLFVLLVIQASTTMAQSTSFKEYLGGAADWWPQSIASGANGQLYMIINEDAGNTEKIVIACTDSLGNLLWQKKWGEDDGLIRPRIIETLPNGQLLVVGTYSNPSGGGSDGIIMVMQANGTPLTQFLLKSNNYETIRDFKIAPNGNYYVLGEIEAGNGYGSFITELTPAGQVVKTRVLTKDLYTYYQYLQVNGEGFYASGFNNPGNGNPGTALLSRFDHNFNLLWTVEMSTPGANVKGYSILPVLPNGHTRQFVRNNNYTYLIERDGNGQYVGEEWLSFSEPIDYVEAAGHYAGITTSGEVMLIDKASGTLSAQMSWDGFFSNPVLLPGNTLVSLGYESVNGTIQTTLNKGVFNFGPGCVGYYTSNAVQEASGVNSNFVQPIISINTALATASVNLQVVDNSNYTLNPGCTTQCNYAPVAAFTYSVADFTINFSADTIDNDATYDWSLSDGSTLSGSGGSFTVAGAGTYQLCLEVEAPCGKTQLCKDVQITVGGAFDRQAVTQLEVLPNPASEQFRLSGIVPGTYQYTITDILGRQVSADTKYLDPNTVFHTDNWLSGQQYFFVARKGNAVYAARISKL